MSIQTSSATIKINLPSGIRRNAQEEAKRIGISLQDFIRMLMATYFSSPRSMRATPRDRELFDRTEREIQNGNYAEVRSQKELSAYLDKLSS